jgi:hypothetical protein
MLPPLLLPQRSLLLTVRLQQSTRQLQLQHPTHLVWHALWRRVLLRRSRQR